MLRGRYTGSSGGLRITLRVDVEGPTDRLSGDLADSRGTGGERFLLSFVVPGDQLPEVLGVPAEASVEYSSLDFEILELTDEQARVDLALNPISGAAAERLSFVVDWQGSEFRRLAIRPFVVPSALPPDSAGLAPVLDGTGVASATPIRVADALARAGVAIDVAPPQPLVEGAAGPDAFWSKSELAAAATSLSQGDRVASPNIWQIPFLVAGRFERPRVLGIMFEPDEGNEIARLAAVFYHEIEDHQQVGGSPDRFAREYLFTTVHELGHVLGLPHAWDALGEPPMPDRDASALTFMNYPDTYRFGYTSFYEEFRYRFRSEELEFLWHAPWPAVWPGSQDAGAPDTLLRRIHPSLSLELHSPQGTVATLGEPVQLEVKLKNRSARRVRVPSDVLQLEGGRLRAYVAREAGPGGLGRRFQPLTRMEFRQSWKYLGSGEEERGVPQSMYDVVDLTYGCDGFPFHRPGRYRITVAAEITADFQVQSAPLALEIRRPAEELAPLVRELSRPALGRALVLGFDPRSDARQGLERIAAESGLPAAAATAALRLGEALARPFKNPLPEAANPADPAEAARWLGRAIDSRSKAKALANPIHSHLLHARARCLALAGQESLSRQAFASLLDFVDQTIRDNGRLRQTVRRDLKREWSHFKHRASTEEDDR